MEYIAIALHSLRDERLMAFTLASHLLGPGIIRRPPASLPSTARPGPVLLSEAGH
jgi:hypothetical protein